MLLPALLEKFPLLAELDGAEGAELFALFEEVTFAKGDVVFEMDDDGFGRETLFVAKSGRFREAWDELSRAAKEPASSEGASAAADGAAAAAAAAAAATPAAEACAVDIMPLQYFGAPCLFAPLAKISSTVVATDDASVAWRFNAATMIRSTTKKEAKAARVTATEEAVAEEAAAEEAAGAGGAELDGAEAAADDAATALRSRGGWSARVAYRSPAGRRMSGVLHAAATTGQLSLFRGDGNDAEHAYPVMSTQVSGGCWWCCARESDANDLSLTYSSFLSPLSSSFSLLVSSHLSNYRPNAGLHD
jgi:hypothetical protein